MSFETVPLDQGISLRARTNISIATGPKAGVRDWTIAENVIVCEMESVEGAGALKRYSLGRSRCSHKRVPCESCIRRAAAHPQSWTVGSSLSQHVIVRQF